jgi:hypothetical protein
MTGNIFWSFIVKNITSRLYEKSVTWTYKWYFLQVAVFNTLIQKRIPQMCFNWNPHQISIFDFSCLACHLLSLFVAISDVIHNFWQFWRLFPACLLLTTSTHSMAFTCWDESLFDCLKLFVVQSIFINSKTHQPSGF